VVARPPQVREQGRGNHSPTLLGRGVRV